MELIESTKYKKTDIGFVPEDWEIQTLKDISFMKGRIGWQGLNQKEFNFNADDPFLITGMNFKDGEIRWNEVYHVPFARYEIAKEIQLKEGDVLMTKDGTIGKLLYVNKIPYPHKATLNSHLLLFRPLNKSYFPKYLYYNLASPFFTKHIELTKSGTTFFGVSQSSVGEYKILLPKITEQEAIAEALSDSDAMISCLEKLIAKKKFIKQGMMQKLLTPKEGWVKKKLGEVAEFMNGKGHEQFISESGQYIVINSKFVSTEGTVFKNSNVNLCPLSKNDITIVMSDIPNGKALAKCFIVPVDNLYALNQRIGGIRAVSVHYKYLAYVLNRNDYYLSFDSGSGQTNLKKNDVLDCPLHFPATMEEQNEIATIIDEMEKEVRQIENKHKKYQEIKQGMMQVLLTGKVRLV